MNINDITILEGVEKMDFDKVTDMLSRAQWSIGIKKDEVIKQAENSGLVIGAFYDGQQVGFARAITDKTRFSYVSDVYVDENFRKMGIAKKMMEYMLGHESLKDVYQWVLTSDADELYEKLGFVPLSKKLTWMEKWQHDRPQR